MEPLFVNKFVLTYPLHREMQHAFHRRYAKGKRKMVLTISVLAMVVGLVEILRGHMAFGIFFVAMSFVYYGLMMLSVERTSKRAYRSITDVLGPRPEYTYSCYEDRIELKTAASKSTIPLGNVTGTFATARLYVLLVQHVGANLSKSGFTVGTPEEFQHYLQEKCPQAFRES